MINDDINYKLVLKKLYKIYIIDVFMIFCNDNILHIEILITKIFKKT